MVRRWLLLWGLAVCLGAWCPVAAFAASGPYGLEEVVGFMSALPDRRAGGEGAQAAADYLVKAFKELTPNPGRQVGRQRFLLPVRMVRQSRLTLLKDGRSIDLPVFLANAMSPGCVPAPGREGTLVYAGQGRLEDLRGQEVRGRVVLMDMDSGKNWQNAAMLGALAVIYLDSPDLSPAPRGRWEDKRETTPIDFPRFWLDRGQAEDLFGRLTDPGLGLRVGPVRLERQVVWEPREAQNVYCLIPGPDKKDRDLLIVQTFYDTETLVPGHSPGAGQAAGAAALLALARELGQNPPNKNVLLVATAGQFAGLAGQREFWYPLTAKTRNLREERDGFTRRVADARQALALYARPDLFTAELEPADRQLLVRTLGQELKTHLNDLSMRLASMRLLPNAQELQEQIQRLSEERMAYRRLGWLAEFSGLDAEQRDLLTALLPRATASMREELAWAEAQLAAAKSGSNLRTLLSRYKVGASVSLHLSDRGEGLGGFAYGFFYDLDPQENRTRLFSPLDHFLNRAVAGMEPDLSALYQDTLRPSIKRPWQNYLPDRPDLGGEVPALAGELGFTLATTGDARPRWGTPYDTPASLDLDFLERQQRLVIALVGTMARAKVPDSGIIAQNSYSNLGGRVNLLRLGELFPDQPAAGTVVQVFQGERFFHSMVDTSGHFQAVGLMNRKVTVHKAVLEPYRFDPETGRAVYAVDKKQTGKDNYRVKMVRRDMETDLVMFACEQTTIFNTLEPRTLRYLWLPEPFDARTEAKPLRYWWARFDTWRSTLGALFLEPEAWLKLALSDTVLTRKMLLLNTKPDDPRGQGFLMNDWPVIPFTEHQVATDMWRLLSGRIQNLESHGIRNQRIAGLATAGQEHLAQADQARERRDWPRFFEESRAAWALAARVYSDIDQTQKDVLVGVLFYIALFIPFAYCMERLIFAYADIHKRIVAFLGVLLATIFVIYEVHPAFRLTYSPTVVILAFFILGLSVLVSLIIFMRFEQEMANLQRRSRHVKESNISRTKAFGAGFVIGVTNLRRRPVRTALTCATLVILTFTIMNFTSVKSAREHGRMLFSHQTPYQGILVRHLDWDNLPPEAVGMLRAALAGLGPIAPRVWHEHEDRTQPVISMLGRGDQTQMIMGTVGLSHIEPAVSGLDHALVAGRWFTAAERYSLILPQGLANRLGVVPGDPERDQVDLWGIRFQVVGVLGQDAWNAFTDLDGEPMTPVTFPTEQTSVLSDVESEAIQEGQEVQRYQSRYQHQPAERTVIMPYETLLELGGTLKGVAVRPPVNDGQAGQELSDRFGLAIFSGESDGTALYFAADTLNYSGVPNVIVPMIIAVLIVLNTMISSVYERRREIAVYTSVGMAPSHVSFLFIAESLAFGVISVVLGYLLAQTAAYSLADTPLWAGMTANYSSLAGVAAMILVLTVVVLSAIYPSRVAGQIAIPDVNRSWKMPDADGSELNVTLPFLVKIQEQACAGGYLHDYYAAHQDVSHGLFSTDEVQSQIACPIGTYVPTQARDVDCFNLNLRVWLAPFDFGVRQRLHLYFCPSEVYEGFLEIKVHLVREAGEEAVWARLCKSFLNDLRKQLLVWRSLDEQARQGYEDFMHQVLAQGGQSLEVGA